MWEKNWTDQDEYAGVCCKHVFKPWRWSHFDGELERTAGTGKYTKSNHGQSESTPIFLTFTHFCLVFYSVDVYSQQWLHNLFSFRPWCTWTCNGGAVSHWAMVSWSQCVVYGLPGFGFGAVTATRWLMLEMVCSLFLGWGILFGIVDVDHRPTSPTSKYSLAIYCNSIQSIQLYRFIFSNPIHPFRSHPLAKSIPTKSFFKSQPQEIPFVSGDDLTIFTVTLRRSAPCAIDLHRSRDFCRANLRCLEWSVVRILFSSSAAWKGGLLGLEVVVDSGNDVPRWETMKATWD